MRCSNRTVGLTLIELMVVVAILGVVSIFVAPSFSSYMARTKLRGVADEVYADLQYARSEAVQKNQRFQVEFAADGYSIWRMQRAAPANRDVSTSAAPNPVKTVSWSGSGVQASGGSSMLITFDPVRATAAVDSGPLDLAHGAIGGVVRVVVGVSGRTELCSPSGSIKGVPAC